MLNRTFGYAWILKPHALDKLILSDIYLSVKQNLSYVWLLEPHALGKLILLVFSYVSNRTLVMHGSTNHISWVNWYFWVNCLSVKQNLSYAWLLEPHTLDKLILPDIYLSVKQNLNYAWLLGSHALGKLKLPIIFLSIK